MSFYLRRTNEDERRPSRPESSDRKHLSLFNRNFLRVKNYLDKPADVDYNNIDNQEESKMDKIEKHEFRKNCLDLEYDNIKSPR